MTTLDVHTHAPADLAVHVTITWSELLRTPDRKLRRMMADRYRQAVSGERLISGVLSEIEAGGIRATARRRQLDAMLDAECARLEAMAQWRYERMAEGYARRVRTGREVAA